MKERALAAVTGLCVVRIGGGNRICAAAVNLKRRVNRHCSPV